MDPISLGRTGSLSSYLNIAFASCYLIASFQRSVHEHIYSCLGTTNLDEYILFLPILYYTSFFIYVPAGPKYLENNALLGLLNHEANKEGLLYNNLISLWLNF